MCGLLGICGKPEGLRCVGRFPSPRRLGWRGPWLWWMQVRCCIAGWCSWCFEVRSFLAILSLRVSNGAEMQLRVGEGPCLKSSRDVFYFVFVLF